MQYRKLDHNRSSFLSQYVQAVYELTSLHSDSYYKTIPNGIIGLTVLVEGSAWTEKNEMWLPVKKTSFYGMIKSPSTIKVSADCRDISIVFNPVHLSSFLKMPMHHISNRFTEAGHIFLAHDLTELEDKLRYAANDPAIIDIIEKFLLKYFNHDRDDQMLYAYHRISNVAISRVHELSKELNITSRTMLNKFNNKIGLSPKELMKIFRVKNALGANTPILTNFTELAYKLGYFDQAHFIHEFKQTIGITPEKYFTNKNMISDFYNLERWNLI